MAPAEHSKTVDFGIKLASLMSAPHVSNMPTLDKLTDLELNHLIVEEEEPADANEPLSHMLSQIFRTFTLEVPDATELQVPLHKIRYRDTRLYNKFAHLDEQSMVPLYDEVNRRWNWALPKLHRESGINQLPDLEEGGDGEENSRGNSESGSESGGESPSTQEHPPEVSTTSITCSAVAWRRQTEVMAANSGAVVRTWSACNSMHPMKDEEVSRKPDLALLDDMEAQWDTIKAVCELTSQLYTPTGMIGKTIDSKAYLLLRCQPWRRFVLLFSLTNEYREFRVHMYDHAGGVVTPPIHIDNAPNRYLQIISGVIFGNLECIRYDPSISIFTKTLQPVQLKNPISRPSTNKQPARDQVQESPIEGTVPKMIVTPESDLEMDSDVEIGSDSEESLPIDPPQLEIPEDPLHMSFSDPIGRIIVNDHAYDILEVIFSSQGLVGHGTICYLARRDDEEYIIKDHWVLGGKDVALNEVEMLREMQGVHGVPELVEYWLIEIAPNEVDETMNYQYKVLGSIKGTSRMHIHLVLKPCARPLHAFWTKVELVSAPWDIVKIQQIAVEDCGILHRDCSLNNAMIEDDGNGTHGLLIDWEFAGTLPFMSRSLLWQLSEAVGDPATSACSWKAKVATSSLAKLPPLILHHYHDDLESLFYIFMSICIEFRGPLGHPNVQKLQKQFHPYFKMLLPLATQWYHLIRNKGPSSAVTFQEILNLLETHLAKLPKNEPSPELLFAKKVIAALPKKRNASDFEGDDPADHLKQPSITERNKMHGRMGWTMEVTPQPKRSRTS
ncbi:hypothetical protein F4604DRAFT_1930759 [Suillus subluteus]|nr:hypothetical protein F4604DRAFT_1930759 [Suillus subluteus]